MNDDGWFNILVLEKQGYLTRVDTNGVFLKEPDFSQKNHYNFNQAIAPLHTWCSEQNLDWRKVKDISKLRLPDLTRNWLQDIILVRFGWFGGITTSVTPFKQTEIFFFGNRDTATLFKLTYG